MTVNVYHKHSVVKAKKPDAKQLELGEIAINANQDSPALYIKDSADNIIEIGGGCDCDEINRRLDEIEHLIESLPTDEQLEKIDNLLDELQKLEEAIEENKKCCESNSQELDDLTARVIVLETEVKQLKIDVEQNTTDITQLKLDVAVIKDDLDEAQKDIEANREDLEKIDIVAGPGVNVVHAQDTFRWNVSIDRAWLDKVIADALKPYALLDIDDNLGQLPNP